MAEPPTFSLAVDNTEGASRLTNGNIDIAASAANQTAKRVLEFCFPVTLSNIHANRATTKPAAVPFSIRSERMRASSSKGTAVIGAYPPGDAPAIAADATLLPDRFAVLLKCSTLGPRASFRKNAEPDA